MKEKENNHLSGEDYMNIPNTRIQLDDSETEQQDDVHHPKDTSTVNGKQRIGTHGEHSKEGKIVFNAMSGGIAGMGLVESVRRGNRIQVPSLDIEITEEDLSELSIKNSSAT